MDNLQLHIKVALLSGQVLQANARAASLQNAAQLMLDGIKTIREQVNGLLQEFPSDTHIEGLVRECNLVEKRQWLNLVDEARAAVGGLHD